MGDGRRPLRGVLLGRRDLNDHEELTSVASGAGLEPGETRTYLERGDGTDEVRRYLVEAYRLGIVGVPSYVVDGGYAFSGTQPVGVFLRVLDVVRAG